MIRSSTPRRRDEYDILAQIGKGTYGLVHKAVDKVNGSIVALKQVLIKHEREGFPVTAIREIKILKQLHHPNIVDLIDIICDYRDEATPSTIFIVFELCTRDLAAAIHDRLPLRGSLSTNETKWIFRQIMEGVAYCHSEGVFHRDLKLSNILLTSTGQVKIADFGLAKHLIQRKGKLTNRVVTRWYRPPELLLGVLDYGPEVDVWSAGCILGELLTGKPLFPGETEADMIYLISEIFGFPDEKNFPGVSQLREFVALSQAMPGVKRDRAKAGKASRSFNQLFPFHLVDTKAIIKDMLRLNPLLRPSAQQVLDHPYWKEDPEFGIPPTPPIFAFEFEEVSPISRKRKASILS